MEFLAYVCGFVFIVMEFVGFGAWWLCEDTLFAILCFGGFVFGGFASFLFWEVEENS